jgi:octaprenyl-diphosphate synthase
LKDIKLSDISKPVDNELAEFKNYFKSSLKSSIGLVDLVTKYILKQKSKKIRPLLVMLSSKVAGEVSERSYRGAVLVEILHTATLVHDDVVDNAEQRRGLPSINAVWKNKVAVLMGDYLLAKGLSISVQNKDFDFLEIITDTVRRMSEGELLQIKKTKKLNIDEETYFRIISDKTAALFSTCCEIGALSNDVSEEKRIALRDFGENLGIAFQIRDDILDYVGKSKVTGKPLGGDIKEKKITLPLIHSLNKAQDGEKSEIIKFIKRINKKDKVEDIFNFVKKYDGIDYAYSVAEEYINKAKSNLKMFGDSESRKALEALLDFVVTRKN